MDTLLRGMLNDSARHIGLALPCLAHEKAVKVGMIALSEGHDIDVAFEVARSVLLQERSAALLVAA